MKILTCLNVIVLIFLISLNFYFKNNFYEMLLMSRTLDAKIVQEKQNVATLNAELAYVTSHKYLSSLSRKHLKLAQIEHKQIVRDFKQASKIIETIK